MSAEYIETEEQEIFLLLRSSNFEVSAFKKHTHTQSNYRIQKIILPQISEKVMLQVHLEKPIHGLKVGSFLRGSDN